MRPNIALSSGKPLVQIINAKNHDQVVDMMRESGNPSRIEEYVNTIFLKSTFKNAIQKVNGLIALGAGSEFMRLVDVDTDDESVSISQKPVFELALSTCIAIKGFHGVLNEISNYVFGGNNFVGMNKPKIFAGILVKCMELNPICKTAYNLHEINPGLYSRTLTSDILVNLDSLMENDGDNN